MAIRGRGHSGDHPAPAPADPGAGSQGRPDARPAPARAEPAGLRLYPPGALKPSPSWYIRGTYLGVRVYRSARTGRQQAAEREMRRIEREIEDSRFLARKAAPRPTFAAAAGRYLKTCGVRDVPLVRKLILQIGDKPLDEIDGPYIRQAVEALYPGRSAGTKNRHGVAPLAAILHQASEFGECRWLRIKRYKEPPGRAHFVTPETAAAFIAAADPPRLARLALFLCGTGARLGEAITRTGADLDLPGARVHFRDTKNGHDRTAHLTAGLVACLAEIDARPDQLLFGYRDRFEVRREWNRVRDRLGLDDFTPHVCRHSYATWLRQNGHDLKFLMDAGGWRDVKSVARYAHVDVGQEVRSGIDRSPVATLKIVKGP